MTRQAQVQLGINTVIDTTLGVAGVSEQVTVTAETSLVNRTAPTGGAVKVGLKDGALTFDIVEAAPAGLPKPEEGEGDAEREPEQVEDRRRPRRGRRAPPSSPSSPPRP